MSSSLPPRVRGHRDRLSYSLRRIRGRRQQQEINQVKLGLLYHFILDKLSIVCPQVPSCLPEELQCLAEDQTEFEEFTTAVLEDLSDKVTTLPFESCGDHTKHSLAIYLSDKMTTQHYWLLTTIELEVLQPLPLFFPRCPNSGSSNCFLPPATMTGATQPSRYSCYRSTPAGSKHSGKGHGKHLKRSQSHSVELIFAPLSEKFSGLTLVPNRR